MTTEPGIDDTDGVTAELVIAWRDVRAGQSHGWTEVYSALRNMANSTLAIDLDRVDHFSPMSPEGDPGLSIIYDTPAKLKQALPDVITRIAGIFREHVTEADFHPVVEEEVDAFSSYVVVHLIPIQ